VLSAVPRDRRRALIRKHFEGVLAWVTSRQTNGFLEAINSLFQAAKRLMTLSTRGHTQVGFSGAHVVPQLIRVSCQRLRQ
jgi:Transposase